MVGAGSTQRGHRHTALRAPTPTDAPHVRLSSWSAPSVWPVSAPAPHSFFVGFTRTHIHAAPHVQGRRLR